MTGEEICTSGSYSQGMGKLGHLSSSATLAQASLCSSAAEWCSVKWCLSRSGGAERVALEEPNYIEELLGAASGPWGFRLTRALAPKTLIPGILILMMHWILRFYQ